MLVTKAFLFINMSNSRLTDEINSYAAIASLAKEHSSLEATAFLNLTKATLDTVFAHSLS